MPQITLRELLNQAIAHHQAGRLAEAEAIYRQILNAMPDEPNALHLCGLLLHNSGRREAALAMIRRAVELRPQQAAFRSNLGHVLAALGRDDEALTEFRTALELRPDSADILNNFGHMLTQTGSPQEAIPLLRKSIELLPAHASAHNNLGNALRAIGDATGAVESLHEAIRLSPNEAVYHNNLGNALQDAGDLESAVTAFNRAIELQPKLAEAYNNRGTTFRMHGRFDESITSYRKAIEIQPDYAMPHFNLGLTLLLMGQFDEGWREAEWRWKVKEHRLRIDKYPQPLWNGADLHGQQILLHPEQGFGDEIQFVRYAPLVAARGGRVLLACQPQLTRLFGQIPSVETILTHGDKLPFYDVHAPLLSLPRIFGTNLSNIPANKPYLHAAPELSAKWSQRLADKPGRKIGLAWAGRPQHRLDRLRSIPLEALSPITSIPGIRFISLQKGPAAEKARDTNPRFDLLDRTDDLTDFADTAALIDNLDLVITVDTSIAHLAGAMGKPVWVLLQYVPDWRWMLDRMDSPWYPTMRLFRQSKLNNWAQPIDQLAQALREQD